MDKELKDRFYENTTYKESDVQFVQELHKEKMLLENDLATIKIKNKQLQRVCDAVTDNGRLKAVHLKTWAETLKKEIKYGSELVCLLQQLQQSLTNLKDL